MKFKYSHTAIRTEPDHSTVLFRLVKLFNWKFVSNIVPATSKVRLYIKCFKTDNYKNTTCRFQNGTQKLAIWFLRFDKPRQRRGRWNFLRISRVLDGLRHPPFLRLFHLRLPLPGKSLLRHWKRVPECHGRLSAHSLFRSVMPSISEKAEKNQIHKMLWNSQIKADNKQNSQNRVRLTIVSTYRTLLCLRLGEERESAEIAIGCQECWFEKTISWVALPLKFRQIVATPDVIWIFLLQINNKRSFIRSNVYMAGQINITFPIGDRVALLRLSRWSVS